MYSRNLSKNTVRASPSYASSTPKYTDLLASQHGGESRFRYSIPPGYDGNRFSRTQPMPETDTKHHTAPPTDQSEPLRKEADILPFPLEQRKGEPEHNALPVEVKTEHEDNLPVPSDPLGSLISALKSRVSSDDLLLIVIILMLAAEGENAEITILLLSLLLLVK